MTADPQSSLRSLVPRAATAAVVGAIVFVIAQIASGFPQHIAGFMGRQIAITGGYPAVLAPLIVPDLRRTS